MKYVVRRIWDAAIVADGLTKSEADALWRECVGEDIDDFGYEVVPEMLLILEEDEREREYIMDMERSRFYVLNGVY